MCKKKNYPWWEKINTQDKKKDQYRSIQSKEVPYDEPLIQVQVHIFPLVVNTSDKTRYLGITIKLKQQNLRFYHPVGKTLLIAYLKRNTL